MALKISKNVGLTDIVSVGEKPLIRTADSVQVDYQEIAGYPAAWDPSLYTVNPDYNPLNTDHPIAGSAVEVQLWLFNDDATKTYQTITIDPTDAVATDESTYVQLAPDNAGAAGVYLAGGVALTMADISDSDVAKPFWYKITMPAVSDTQNKSDIKLFAKGKEYAV